MDVSRRGYLSLCAATVVAGCGGDAASGRKDPTPTVATTESDESTPTRDDNPSDGYPPPTEGTPSKRSVDPSSFSTATYEGTTVPLVPVDVAYYWYQRRAARFADARGEGQYLRSHIVGAVHSPAPDGGEGDPVDDWPKGDRVVCYCGCPHHLSVMRAGTLLSNGYEEVYAIDQGFYGWRDRGYPVTGGSGDVDSYVIEGRVEGTSDGMALAVHERSEQREAAPIDDRGRYGMTLHFGDLPADAPIRLRTPTYTLTAPLSALTSGVVTGPDSV